MTVKELLNVLGKDSDTRYIVTVGEEQAGEFRADDLLFQAFFDYNVAGLFAGEKDDHAYFEINLEFKAHLVRGDAQ